MKGLSGKKRKAVQCRQTESCAVVSQSAVQIAKPLYGAYFLDPPDALGMIQPRIIVDDSGGGTVGKKQES